MMPYWVQTLIVPVHWLARVITWLVLTARVVPTPQQEQIWLDLTPFLTHSGITADQRKPMLYKRPALPLTASHPVRLDAEQPTPLINAVGHEWVVVIAVLLNTVS